MEGADNSGDGSISEQFLGAHGYQEDSGQDGDEGDQSFEPLRDQDRFLPIANVARIMKHGIPKSGKVAKDAKECVQECVSEFISFITSEASDRCQQEKRKTINGEDILFAMTSLGFDNYVEPLKQYLQKFRDTQKGEQNKGMPLGEGLMDDITGAGDENFSNTTLAGTLLTQDGQNILYSNQYSTQLNQVTTPSLNFQ